MPRSPAPLTLSTQQDTPSPSALRLWLVTCTLGLRTGPPSLFTWLDSQLTKRVGRQTASCVCEDISRQDSLSSKTNPGCGWSTSRGRNSKGMKWEWGWGGDRTRQEPASLCFCLPTHQFLGHTHPLPRCSAKHTGPRDHGPNSLTPLAKITLPPFTLFSDSLQCKLNQQTLPQCYCPFLPVVTWWLGRKASCANTCTMRYGGGAWSASQHVKS